MWPSDLCRVFSYPKFRRYFSTVTVLLVIVAFYEVLLRTYNIHKEIQKFKKSFACHNELLTWLYDHAQCPERQQTPFDQLMTRQLPHCPQP